MQPEQLITAAFEAEYRQSSEGGMHFVLVPASVKNQFAERGIARVVAQVDDLSPFQCGLMPYRNGDGYIILNKGRQKMLGKAPGQPVRVTLRKDDSAYGAPMPEELEAVLAQDPDARAAFEALTPGRKRAVMYGVGREKGVERRIEAAVKLLTDPRAGHARW